MYFLEPPEFVKLTRDFIFVLSDDDDDDDNSNNNRDGTDRPHARVKENRLTEDGEERVLNSDEPNLKGIT